VTAGLAEQTVIMAAADVDGRGGGLGARVAVVVVTWNRKTLVSAQIEALSRQTFGTRHLDVVVIDNASTDGTLEFLRERWKPEAIVQNEAKVAHEPRFVAAAGGVRIGEEPRTNAGGFGSFTIVRNADNFGGCGGFNTGFAFVEQFVGVQAGGGAGGGGAGSGPEFIWLADDDAIADDRALEHLVAGMRSDPKIGLVGSRTVDISDRKTTIESTIYFDAQHGRMSDEPVPGHPMHASHQAWISQVGGTKGVREFTGLRDVDVVSACSVLGRWSMVKQIGFWDYRYFIYCDDADWALRFGKAGHRVVLSLDAVVYHTPWLLKLTPARLYYSQRNIVWTLQKIVPRDRVRAVTLRWLGSFVKLAAKAALCRRRTIAEVYRRAAHDAATGVWGKLDMPQPPTEDVFGALDRLGVLRRDARIAVVCNNWNSTELADEIRGRVAAKLLELGRSKDLPAWVYICRNDVADAGSRGSDSLLGRVVPPRVIYSTRKRSKFRRQIGLFARPAKAVIVLDHYCEFPLLTGGHNIHVDRKDLSKGYVEADGVGSRIGFGLKLVGTAVRAAWYSMTFGTKAPGGKYG
jgi:GT2 family glycosyltransferase